jgi:hypothetical protein
MASGFASLFADLLKANVGKLRAFAFKKNKIFISYF